MKKTIILFGVLLVLLCTLCSCNKTNVEPNSDDSLSASEYVKVDVFVDMIDDEDEPEVYDDSLESESFSVLDSDVIPDKGETENKEVELGKQKNKAQEQQQNQQQDVSQEQQDMTQEQQQDVQQEVTQEQQQEVSQVQQQDVSQDSISGNNEEENNMYIPYPKDPDVLNVEQENRIKSDYLKFYIESNPTYVGDSNIDDIEIQNYYGTYNGSVVIMIRGHEGFTGADYKRETAGYVFHYNSSQQIQVWKDGSFYTLTLAYEQGLLSQQDIKAIFSIFKINYGGTFK